MSKLNALGLELLDLKEATKQEYPEVAKRVLSQTIDDLLKNNVIDQETHYLLTEHAFATNDFKNFCLGKSNYCKSEEELLSLYEEKRVRLEESLQTCINEQQISVVNYLKDEQIMVVKTYRFGVEQVKQYFGINREEDCDSLMGRRRFIERFVALRYPKILKGFINKSSRPGGLFKLSNSAVYFDEETNEYAIELLFKIEIGTFEEVEISAFERPIGNMIERCNRWFTDHLGIDGDFYSPVHKTKERQQKISHQAKTELSTISKVEKKFEEQPEVKSEPKKDGKQEEVVTTQPNHLYSNQKEKEMTSNNELLVNLDVNNVEIEEPIIELDDELKIDVDTLNFEFDEMAMIDFNPDEVL